MKREVPAWAMDVPVSTDLKWDATFNIVESVYIDDPNDAQKVLREWDKYSVKLPRVEYPLIDRRKTTSTDIAAQPAMLLEHYKAVIDVCDKCNLPLKRSHVFSLGLGLLDGHTEILSFIDLYDTFFHFKWLIDRIKMVKEGYDLDDCDECWSMQTYYNSGIIIFRESDELSEDRETANSKIVIRAMNMADVEEQLNNALKRTEGILALVHKELGLNLLQLADFRLEKTWEEILVEKPF